jgi:hypothetical protein
VLIGYLSFTAKMSHHATVGDVLANQADMDKFYSGTLCKPGTVKLQSGGASLKKNLNLKAEQEKGKADEERKMRAEEERNNATKSADADQKATLADKGEHFAPIRLQISRYQNCSRRLHKMFRLTS